MMLAVVLAWGLAIGLSVVAAGDGVLPGDVRFAHWVQRADGSFPSDLAAFGNRAGAYWTGAGIALIVAVGLAWARRWSGIVLLIAVLLVRALNTMVKGWIDSPRPTPDLIRITEDADGLGFPSGHASGAMLLYGAFMWIAWTGLAAGFWRTAVAAGCVVTIVIVGWARVFTGAHWPSDVLGGYLLGFAILGTIVIALARGNRLERST